MKKNNTKLQIRRETLRELSSTQLVRVQGGAELTGASRTSGCGLDTTGIRRIL